MAQKAASKPDATQPDEDSERQYRLVAHVLASLRLSHLLDIFRSQLIDDSVFTDLSNDELKELGIEQMGARKKLIKVIAALKASSLRPPASGVHPDRPGALDSDSEDADRRKSIGSVSSEGPGALGLAPTPGDPWVLETLHFNSGPSPLHLLGAKSTVQRALRALAALGLPPGQAEATGPWGLTPTEFSPQTITINHFQALEPIPVGAEPLITLTEPLTAPSPEKPKAKPQLKPTPMPQLVDSDPKSADTAQALRVLLRLDKSQAQARSDAASPPGPRDASELIEKVESVLKVELDKLSANGAEKAAPEASVLSLPSSKPSSPLNTPAVEAKKLVPHAPDSPDTVRIPADFTIRQWASEDLGKLEGVIVRYNAEEGDETRAEKDRAIFIAGPPAAVASARTVVVKYVEQMDGVMKGNEMVKSMTEEFPTPLPSFAPSPAASAAAPPLSNGAGGQGGVPRPAPGAEPSAALPTSLPLPFRNSAGHVQFNYPYAVRLAVAKVYDNIPVLVEVNFHLDTPADLPRSKACILVRSNNQRLLTQTEHEIQRIAKEELLRLGAASDPRDEQAYVHFLNAPYDMRCFAKDSGFLFAPGVTVDWNTSPSTRLLNNIRVAGPVDGVKAAKKLINKAIHAPLRYSTNPGFAGPPPAPKNPRADSLLDDRGPPRLSKSAFENFAPRAANVRQQSAANDIVKCSLSVRQNLSRTYQNPCPRTVQIHWNLDRSFSSFTTDALYLAGPTTDLLRVKHDLIRLVQRHTESPDVGGAHGRAPRNADGESWVHGASFNPNVHPVVPRGAQHKSQRRPDYAEEAAHEEYSEEYSHGYYGEEYNDGAE